MCNNYIITQNTTGSVHLPVGPKRMPQHGPHDWEPPSPCGGVPAPPGSGAASRRHPPPPRDPGPPAAATPRPPGGWRTPIAGGRGTRPPAIRGRQPPPRNVYIENHIPIFLRKINYIIAGVCLLPAILPVYIPFLDGNLKQYHWVSEHLF